LPFYVPPKNKLVFLDFSYEISITVSQKQNNVMSD
jgi:hypothetical protein